MDFPPFVMVYHKRTKSPIHAEPKQDNSGSLIITNRFEDVPKKYRDRVKVVWDKDLEAKDPVARRSTAALEQYERDEAAKRTKSEADEKKNSAKKGKTLVIELDENTGKLIRRFE